MSEYGLGWKKSPEDPRDWSPELLKTMVALGTAEPVAWIPPHILRQNGNKCVGFSWATYVSAPTATSPADPSVTNALGDEIYLRAKAEEGIGPDDPAFGEGAYLRSGAKACKDMGLISAFAMTDYAGAEEWLSRGSVVIGIPWYKQMFTPDAQGVIHPGGSYEGGHAICWSKNHQLKPADNGLPNTWDYTWGADGWCFVSDPDLYDLMQKGEACCAVKITGVPYADEYDWGEEGILAVNYLFAKGIMTGYPLGKFAPGQRHFLPAEPLTYRHVALIAERVKLSAPPGWKKDYRPCTRAAVRDTFPGFTWNEDRWAEPVTRYQMALLLYRWSLA